MPETLEEFDFQAARRESSASNSLYAWDEWIQDGVIRTYVAGVDFQTTVRHFASQLRRAAWKRGYKMEMVRTVDRVTAQPSPRTDAGWLQEQEQARQLRQQHGRRMDPPPPPVEPDPPIDPEPPSPPVTEPLDVEPVRARAVTGDDGVVHYR